MGTMRITDAGIVPYSSRAAAQAASVPPWVFTISYTGPSRDVLQFVEDADATSPALTTADGRKWVPAGAATPEHYGAVIVSRADFEALDGSYGSIPASNSAALRAIRAAQAPSVKLSDGVFLTDQEWIVDWVVDITANGPGRNWRPGVDDASYDPICEIRFVGDGAAYRTEKTRRAYRGSGADPTDDLISAGINIQMSGVRIAPGVTVALDDSATNWDVGVFVGCRVDVNVGCGIRGNWLKTNCYVDVTRGPDCPELVGWDGQQYPVTREYGADGFQMPHPATSGGRWGLVILGALPKPGLISYGRDYTVSLPITFGAAPAIGDTLTLGDVTLAWSDAPDGDLSLPIPASAAAAAAQVAEFMEDAVLGDPSSSLTYPEASLASYLADGAVLRCFRRAPTSSAFDSGFSASTNAAARIDVGDGDPVTGSDPALYWHGSAAVSDARGGYGASDVLIGPGGVLQSGDLADTAGQRRVDIRPDHDPALEGWSAGSCWIDGLAANGSRCIQGLSMFKVRMQSIEPFSLRLGRVNNLTLLDTVHDRFGLMSVRDTSGALLSSVYASAKDAYYGPISNSNLTKALRWIGAKNGYYPEYFDPTLNNSIMLGSTVGSDTVREITARIALRAGQDLKGNESGKTIYRVGRTSGWGGIVVEDGVDTFLAALRWYRSSLRWSLEISGSQLCYMTLTSDGMVMTSIRPNGISIRSTSTDANAIAELRAGANSEVRFRTGSTLQAVISATDTRIASGQLRIGGTTGPIIRSGTGSPEGAVTAPVGSIYQRSDGGAGSSMYVKESGTGNTGWVEK